MSIKLQIASMNSDDTYILSNGTDLLKGMYVRANLIIVVHINT